jgi:hypothetical protein
MTVEIAFPTQQDCCLLSLQSLNARALGELLAFQILQVSIVQSHLIFWMEGQWKDA